MFTGLVEEMGTVRRAGPEGDGFVLDIAASIVVEDVKFGDSINVNGDGSLIIEYDGSNSYVPPIKIDLDE